MGRPAASTELAMDLRDAEEARARLKKRERVPISTGVLNSGEEDAIWSVSHDKLQVLPGKQTQIYYFFHVDINLLRVALASWQCNDKNKGDHC